MRCQTSAIIHSRAWKCQIPYLARHFRVVTFDGRGNGLSDRPPNASAYAASEFIARDAGRILDGDYLPAFGLDRCCEELDAVVAAARELGVPFELSSEVARAYRRALERYGAVDGELLAVALLEERAGVKLRR